MIQQIRHGGHSITLWQRLSATSGVYKDSYGTVELINGFLNITLQMNALKHYIIV